MLTKSYYEYSEPEELDIELEDSEFEEVLKGASYLRFPAITLSKYNKLYLNTSAMRYFQHDYAKFYTTSEYIIILPSKKGFENSFRLTPLSRGCGAALTIPKDMEEKKLKMGTYKLYKYKNGLCFKRYERINTMTSRKGNDDD